MKYSPQQHEAASKIYLGCLMMDKEALLKRRVPPEALYGGWQYLYLGMLKNLVDGKGIQPADLYMEFGKEEWWPGAKIVSDLPNNAVSGSRAKGYAEKLIEMFQFLQVMRWNKQLELMIEGGEEEILAKAEAGLLKIRSEDETVCVKLSEAIRMLNENPGNQKISVGESRFDAKLALTRGGLHVLAARPSMGKSSLAVWLSIMAARGHPVMIFTLEMTTSELVRRMLGMGVDIQNLPIWINDKAGMTIEEIMTRAQIMRGQYGIDLVVVDYMQLVRTSTKHQNREREVAYVSSCLKELSKKIDAPVLALSQLNRELEGRSNKRPTLANLRESGAIEQDADTVTFLYREDYYADQEGKTSHAPGVVEVLIAKQRGGATGVMLANWERAANKWHSWRDKGEPESPQRDMGALF